MPECFFFGLGVLKARKNFLFSDKDCFKLRSNIEKCVVITMCQVSDNLTTLKVDRCFGMLVSPGRNVRHSDMQLLEDVRMTRIDNHWSISGSWDPREAAFAVLNQETGPEIQSVYMTVAADLVINQVTVNSLIIHTISQHIEYSCNTSFVSFVVE